ncbi:hypothetical protein KIPB_012169, partial [Kipferlia bialata]|eukprot:g12169.t1
MSQTTIIIGAIAAGTACAASLRRRDENHNIIMIDKGEFISTAVCGMPMHLSGEIPGEDSLVVMPPAKFIKLFNIDLRLNTEMLSVNAEAKTVLL